MSDIGMHAQLAMPWQQIECNADVGKMWLHRCVHVGQPLPLPGFWKRGRTSAREHANFHIRVPFVLVFNRPASAAQHQKP